MIEKWKTIKEYPNYQANNFGRIKSLKTSKRKEEMLLNPCKDKNGYLIIYLYHNKKRKLCKVHRIILMTFKPIFNSEIYQCNHIDGNKNNNNINNLEWCTPKENTNHAFRMRLRKGFEGTNNPKCKLSENNVIEIRLLLKEGKLNQMEIAKIFNIACSQVSKIKLNQIWSHVV